MAARSLEAQRPQPFAALPGTYDEAVERNEAELMRSGRQIFRFDTFGDERFWSDALKLHQAIAGAKLGGVGNGVSPATALAVGLKLDVDMLPRAILSAIANRAIDLNDPANTVALIDTKAVLGVMPGPRRRAPVHRPDVRALSLERRRLVRAGHRPSARRLGQSRSERRRDRRRCRPT